MRLMSATNYINVTHTVVLVLTSKREVAFPTTRKPGLAVVSNPLSCFAPWEELEPATELPADPEPVLKDVSTVRDRISVDQSLFLIIISRGKISFFLHVDERDKVTVNGEGEIFTRGTENTIPHTLVVEVRRSTACLLDSPGPL